MLDFLLGSILKIFEEIGSTIVNHDQFNILFIGSVTDRKNLHMIIDAINSLQDQNINLSIVGPTPNEKYLEELKVADCEEKS